MTLRARDIMQPDVLSVGPDVTLADLERFLLDHHVSGVPVLEDGKLVGVVSRSDVVKQITVSRLLANAAAHYYSDHTGLGGPVPGADTPTEDEARVIADRLTTTTVRDAMTENLISVVPDATLAEVAEKLVEHGIHRLLVTRGRELLGVITTLDVVALLLDGRVVVKRD